MMLDEVAALLRMLGDTTRLRLLHLLWRLQERPVPVGALVEALGLPQPTVSRHLALLREAGLVERRAEGTQRHYSLAAVQPRAHAALLGALEAFVASAPEAREDLERVAEPPGEGGLTPARESETKKLDMDEPGTHGVFKALAHPTRRRLLDALAARPGASVAEVAGGFRESRVSVTKHLAVLEAAGLVHSRRRGRERRLYADPMPIQLAYDRWTNRFTATLGTMMADVKHGAEGRHRAEGRRAEGRRADAGRSARQGRPGAPRSEGSRR
ncbi:MAG: metalloregulator ArsR/SmtB family transcription factor [Myxococcota bacterium]